MQVCNQCEWAKPVGAVGRRSNEAGVTTIRPLVNGCLANLAALLHCYLGTLLQWRWLTRKQPTLNVGHHETNAAQDDDDDDDQEADAEGAGQGSAARPAKATPGRRTAPRYWYSSETATVGAGVSAAGGTGTGTTDADGGTSTGIAADGEGEAGVDEGPVVDGWRVRVFDRDSPVYAHRPVCHVSWYEAEAYCR